jgi:hypothetical protein
MRFTMLLFCGNHGNHQDLSWKDPTNIPLLSQIYLGQQRRLQAIVDDLTEIEELSDVSG